MRVLIFLIDLTAIDHGEDEESFLNVIHFILIGSSWILRVHSCCSDNDNPVMPSVADIYPAANWHERELMICLESTLRIIRILNVF